MRRAPHLVFIIAVGLAVVATGCGVVADDTAATVAGRPVSVESVNQLANDPLISGTDAGDDSSVISGEAARSALMFEITATAWVAEADRWGLDLDSTRGQAEAELEKQLAANPPPGGLSDLLTDRYTDITGAQIALGQRFEAIDPTDEGDLRLIYEGVPGLWERTCAWIVTVPDGKKKEIAKLIDDGSSLPEVSKQIPDASLVADPDKGCVSLENLPPEMREPVAALKVDEISKPISVAAGDGSQQVYRAQVQKRQSLSFSEAHDELVQVATALSKPGSQGPQQWVQLIVGTAQIDPRYGSGISPSSAGQLSILPPPAPVQPFGTQAVPLPSTNDGGVPQS